jgi:hypothetical protein
MRIKVIFAIGLFCVAAAANAMTAQTFYTKALALKRQGNLAILSSDYRLLKSEIQVAAKSVKAENATAAANGKPLYCAPANVKIDPDQVIAAFGAIPASRRKTMTVRAAWREIAIRKYPC